MTSPSTNLPGTYRVSDTSAVPFSEALAIWAPMAYDELMATAHSYHAVIALLPQVRRRRSQ